ncbi:hypothetical protein EC12741_1547 [Escherichia coli 1.2741]|uniref:hypothetical protein n=1 Tax=Escherichia sp. HH091_1A TaxID=2509662 RepID=UPI0001FB5A12|nr:hypothetical protein [Escherichia sp. HH091_1A]EGB63443.1 hypothetical protein ERJG_00659 [Escherichia coli M863]EIG82322.1 hypothetical protein EC12741_1547 [Escherichia coli 1.2741]
MLIRLLGFACSVGVMIIVILFPQWGKSINRNGSRYGCLDDLRGHYDHSANDLNQSFSLKMTLATRPESTKSHRFLING